MVNFEVEVCSSGSERLRKLWRNTEHEETGATR